MLTKMFTLYYSIIESKCYLFAYFNITIVGDACAFANRICYMILRELLHSFCDIIGTVMLCYRIEDVIHSIGALSISSYTSF